MEVEQPIFVVHLIITVQLYYYLKTPSLKIRSNKLQMVTMNHSKLSKSNLRSRKRTIGDFSSEQLLRGPMCYPRDSDLSSG